MEQNQVRNEREQKIEIGDKVYFKGQKTPMVAKDMSERYMILTEPNYNKKTVYYSIIDFASQWKAPHNKLYNPYNFEDIHSIAECLSDLMVGKISLSQKRGVKLNIDFERTEHAKKFPGRGKAKNKKES